MNFMEMLSSAWKENDSLLCVGLDPDPARIPDFLKTRKNPLFAFNKAVIDATRSYVCAYKPQAAYYAGSDADEDLKMTIDYIREAAPSVPVILDAKRADIGATSQMYAKEAFDRYRADAVTVNPYMGMDAVKPFLDRADKGVIVLCRTSNAGAKEIQELKVEGEMLYLRIARMIASSWNGNRNVMLVAGATFPEELGRIRSVVGGMPLLVPGVGAQGGDVEAVLRNGLTPDGTGLVINSSRGILYASAGEDFAEAAGEAARSLRDLINTFRRARNGNK